jgi:uncharacterized membrane protein YfcA
MVEFTGYDLWALFLGLVAGLACGFLNTAASSGSAVSLPILMMVGLDPVAANATNRIPVLIGALSATASFQKKGKLLWDMLLKTAVPVTLGSVAGAAIAEVLPGRDLGLIITAAVLVALVLLFTKLKQAIENAVEKDGRFGPKEFALFALIGAWLGFIVLDGATYMLLALVLVVGLPLVHANALKTALLIPSAVVAMAVFAYKGNVDWTIGAVMAAGSIAGGLLGAKFAASERSRKWVFRLLVVVIVGELIHLGVQYFGAELHALLADLRGS